MNRSNRWLVNTSVFAHVSFCALTLGARVQATEVPAKTPELYFWTDHSRQLFSLGKPVVIVLQLYSRSEQPILVSRLWGDEFVSFKLTSPDGNEVPWQGKE